jgi:hypothetical protein
LGPSSVSASSVGTPGSGRFHRVHCCSRSATGSITPGSPTAENVETSPGRSTNPARLNAAASSAAA